MNLCWQPPSRNRCQAAKATCTWGRAGATLPTLRRSQREARQCQRLGGGSSLGQAGQASPGAATLGIQESSPGHGKPPPCSLQGPVLDQHVCFAGLASMLQQNSRGHSHWATAPAWPRVSWSPNTGTGLSPPPSCLPDDRWGGRSSNSNSSNNGSPLLPCARPCVKCLTSILSFNPCSNTIL